MKTSSCFGPAHAPPADGRPHVAHDPRTHSAPPSGGEPAANSPRCWRDSPQKAGWDMAARAYLIVTHQTTCAAVPTSPPTDQGQSHVGSLGSEA